MAQDTWQSPPTHESGEICEPDLIAVYDDDTVAGFVGLPECVLDAAGPVEEASGHRKGKDDGNDNAKGNGNERPCSQVIVTLTHPVSDSQ